MAGPVAQELNQIIMELMMPDEIDDGSAHGVEEGRRRENGRVLYVDMMK